MCWPDLWHAGAHRLCRGLRPGGDIEPITVPELARKAQQELAARCNAPDNGPAVQVKFADTGKPVRRLAVISGAGGSLFDEAIAEGADCLLTGEANHHHAWTPSGWGFLSLRRGITPPSSR